MRVSRELAFEASRSLRLNIGDVRNIGVSVRCSLRRMGTFRTGSEYVSYLEPISSCEIAAIAGGPFLSV